MCEWTFHRIHVQLWIKYIVAFMCGYIVPYISSNPYVSMYKTHHIKVCIKHTVEFIEYILPYMIHSHIHVWINRVTHGTKNEMKFVAFLMMSHMDESRHVWMGHVTCECVVLPYVIHSHIHVWIYCIRCSTKNEMKFVALWMMSHVKESRHMWMGHVTCGFVVVPIMRWNSWRFGWCHIWNSHVTYE